MYLQEIRSAIERIDKEIREQKTGTPEQLASKLEMSTRLLFHYMDIMRLLGAPIDYDKSCNSYIYSKKGCYDKKFIWSESVEKEALLKV
ncbi:MAG: hypothetical protein JEZ14_18020 [Marinilabiliaceae bacterium]|nr:hypothetical protein [Marinilabiliaceae bacterium]